MATQPLISQWFQNRRALAMGLSSAGVGAGGLVFSFTTRAALAQHGIRVSYVINGAIIFAVLTPTTILFKREPSLFSKRVHQAHPFPL
jgi:MFS family permease